MAPAELRVTVGLHDHGETTPVETPAGATTISLEHFSDLANQAGTGTTSELGETEASGTATAVPDTLKRLAGAEEAHYAVEGAYTDELAALRSLGFEPQPGAQFGVCTYDNGQSYVAAAQADSEVVHYDSEHGFVDDTGQLACAPALHGWTPDD